MPVVLKGRACQSCKRRVHASRVKGAFMPVVLCQCRYGEQKIAQFHIHYLTKERSYVSTQNQATFQ